MNNHKEKYHPGLNYFNADINLPVSPRQKSFALAVDCLVPTNEYWVLQISGALDPYTSTQDLTCGAGL
jgi:hypothetical protein